MFIKKTISLFLLIIFVLSAFVGCNDVSDDASSSITTPTSSNVYNVDDDKTESNDNTSGDNITSSEEIDSNVDSSDVSSDQDTSSNNIVSVGDGDGTENNTSEPSMPPTYIEEDDDNTSSGDNVTNTDGYSGETFATAPNAQGKLVTVKIASNSSVFYKIARASNKILTINSANAYVIYDGKKYEAKNGVLSFYVKSDLLARDQIMFEIGNKGSKGESFTVLLTSPLGTNDNPEEIKSIENKFTATVKKDNDQGYFYKYKASNKGKIRFYLLSDAKKYKLSVLQSLKSFKDVVAGGTSDVLDDDTIYCIVEKDSTGVYLEFDVNNGDEFLISVCPLDNIDSSVNIEWKIVI